MALWRKRRMLKLVILLVLVSIIPYFIISNFEAHGVYDTNRLYYISVATGANFLSQPTAKSQLATPTNRSHTTGDNSLLLKTMQNPSTLPLTLEYCNSPNIEINGDEGRVPKGFKLKMVHVFIRHGDRTSMHNLKGYREDGYNCRFRGWYDGNNDKIRRFTDEMDKFAGKQKRNSHFLSWSLYPNKEWCDSSDLTSLGALQHLKNGEFLAKRYIEQTNIFDKHMALSTQIYARSTPTARTYQSAVALLYGLLPYFNITQLNIEHAANKYLCSVSSRLVLSCNCKFLSTLEQRAKKYTSAYHSNSSEYSYIKKTVSDIFNIRHGITRTPWLSAILDAIVPPLCHNLSIPCGTKGDNAGFLRKPRNYSLEQAAVTRFSKKADDKCITADLLQRMWKEYSRSQLESLNDPGANYFQYLSMHSHPVLVETVHRMREMTFGRFAPRFVLYSGHDFTINALLYVLGLQDNKWPPYASRLVFELFKRNLKNNHVRYYFRVLYNGKDLTENVSFCKKNMYKGLCKFKLLADFVFSKMIRRFGYTSYSDACSRTS